MKRKKLLCLSLAAMLVAGNAPQNLVFAQNDLERSIAESSQELLINSLGEEAEQEILEKEDSQEEVLLDEQKDWQEEAAQNELQEEGSENDQPGNVQDGLNEQRNSEEFLSEAADGSDQEGFLNGEEDLQTTENDYGFETQNDGTLLITSYYGTDTMIKIPAQINSKTVSGIYSLGRTDLIRVEIPSGVMDIEPGTFAGCDDLIDITVDAENPCYQSVNGILYNKELTELICCPSGKKEIMIPGSVTYINKYAFNNCSGLTSIKLPSSLEEPIDGSDIRGCHNLVEILIEGENSKYRSIDGILYDKYIEKLICCPLGKREIIIPDSVVEIGSSAFEGCSGLTNIELPSGVTRIGHGAFKGCIGLINMELPSGVTEIESSVFSGCSSLVSIGVPLGVTQIGGEAFSDCRSLINITLSSAVESIYDDTFKGCISLMKIDVDSANPNYQSIDGVLYNKGLTELIRYPAAKKEKEIFIVDSVTTICISAFDDCKNLTSIHLPSNLDHLGILFSGCNNLMEFMIDDKNPYYVSRDGILYDKGLTELYRCPPGKKTIKIPESVTRIINNAFTGCSRLTEIKLPLGVTSIWPRAFKDCSSLKSIELPPNVTEIGEDVFRGCSSLVNVELPLRLERIIWFAFSGCDSLTRIEIPSTVTEIWLYAFPRNQGRFTMVVEPGSHAEEYAKQNGIPYEYKEPSEVCRQELSTITNIPQAATADFTLPTQGKRGGTVTWTSNNKAISIGSPTNAGIKATVKRGQSDVQVVLTATVIYGGASASKTFQTTVKKASQANDVAKQEAKKALNAIKVTKSSITLYTGKVTHTAAIKPVYPKNFTAVLSPAGLKVRSVTYRSSQPKCVSVTKNGVATGLKEGRVTVIMTVTLSDGSKKSFQTKVSVKKPYLKISGKQTVKKGRTLTLKVQKYGVKETAVWSVDKTKVAKINAKTGKLMAKEIGTVKVTVKVGNLKKIYKVTVKK